MGKQLWFTFLSWEWLFMNTWKELAFSGDDGIDYYIRYFWKIPNWSCLLLERISKRSSNRPRVKRLEAIAIVYPSSRHLPVLHFVLHSVSTHVQASNSWAVGENSRQDDRDSTPGPMCHVLLFFAVVGGRHAPPPPPLFYFYFIFWGKSHQTSRERKKKIPNIFFIIHGEKKMCTPGVHIFSYFIIGQHIILCPCARGISAFDWTLNVGLTTEAASLLRPHHFSNSTM